MILSDNHVHTKFSPDGISSVYDMGMSAIDAGINEIAITDHYDAVCDKSLLIDFMAKECLQDIIDARRKLNGRLKILYGIEIGQYHFDKPACDALLKDNDFDIVISSMHNLYNDRELHIIDYNATDSKKVFEEYLLEMLKMSKHAEFDIAAHLNYPSRYIWVQTKNMVDLSAFEDMWRSLFKNIIEKGRGIEVNTSGLRQPINEFLPPIYLVKLYRECGGEIITVGSDAHITSDVGKNIKDGINLIKEAGFSYITRYEKRKPYFEKIDI